MKEDFIKAIYEKHLIRIKFFSKDDNRVIIRKCAPFDFGPSRHSKEKNDRYHVWDYESDTKNHTLSLNPEQIISIEVLKDYFEPSSLITWDVKKSPWFIKRDWGDFS